MDTGADTGLALMSLSNPTGWMKPSTPHSGKDQEID
jgi:hypothetical protein